MKVFKDALNRFRFIGDGCKAVFNEVLVPAEVSKIASTPWFKNYFTDVELPASIKDPNWIRRLCSGAKAVSLVVRDPRLLLPPRKTKPAVVEDTKNGDDVVGQAFEANEDWCPVLNERVRNDVSTSKVPDGVINEKRREHVANGLDPEKMDMGDQEACVPVLVVPISVQGTVLTSNFNLPPPNTQTTDVKTEIKLANEEATLVPLDRS